MAVHLSRFAPALVTVLIALAAVPPSGRASPEDAPTIIHVKRIEEGGDDSHDGLTWATAKASVSAGLGAAPANGQVWVGFGMYPGAQVPAGVSLYGGFAGTETSVDQRPQSGLVTAIDLLYIGENAPATSVVDGLLITYKLGCDSGSRPTLHNVTIALALECFDAAPQVTTCTVQGLVDLYGSAPVFTGCRLEGGLAAKTWSGQSSAPTLDSSVLLNGMTIPFENNVTVRASELSGALLVDEGAFDITASTLHGPLTASYARPSRLEGCHLERGLALTGYRGDITGNVISNTDAPAVSLIGGEVRLLNNRIADCPKEALRVSDGISLTLTGNVITGNGQTASGAAVTCVADDVRLYNNTIAHNPATAVSVNGRVSAEIVNNIVFVNAMGVQVIPGFHAASIRNNAVAMNLNANWLGIPDPTGQNGNLAVEDLGLVEGDVHLRSDSPCIDAGDNSVADGASRDIDGLPRLWGGAVDIGACEFVPDNLPTVYVDDDAPGSVRNGGSWATAFHTIQEAVDLIRPPHGSPGGTDVRVARGTYPEHVVVPSGTLALLRGGFEGGTTDGDARDPQTRTTRIDAGGTENAVVLHERGATVDGFRIERGAPSGIRVETEEAVIRNNVVTQCGNGIVSLAPGAFLEDNTVSNNQLAGIIPGPLATIRACRVTDNQGTGITHADGTLIVNCLIARNAAGIEAEAMGAPTTITGCQIVENRGIGVLAGFEASAIVTRNIIAQNSGAGISLDGSLPDRITNNLVYDNGAGVLVNDIVPIANNTIVGNHGIGLDVKDSMAPGYIVNNIVAWNDAGVRIQSAEPQARVECNDAFANPSYNWQGQGDPTGSNGNIREDPLFVDWAGANLRLQAGSPCIDAGNDGVVSAGATDIDGAPRIRGARVDIGAYESAVPYSLADAVFALRIGAGLDAADHSMRSYYDADGSGLVDVRDAVAIIRLAQSL